MERSDPTARSGAKGIAQLRSSAATRSVGSLRFTYGRPGSDRRTASRSLVDATASPSPTFLAGEPIRAIAGASKVHNSL